MILLPLSKHRNFYEQEFKHDLKIDAKIIKMRHWATKGQPDVDCDDFLGGFERIQKNTNFWVFQKSPKSRRADA